MLFSMTAMAKEVGAPVADYELAAPAEITGYWYWVDRNGKIVDLAWIDYSKDPVTVMPSEIVNAAVDQDKMVGEYMNNAVTGIWAMDKVVPVAQGGGVIVDDNATNLTFSVLKPELSRVYSAKDFAATLNGTLLNVVKVGVPANFGFDVANVNFYTPGITAEQNVKVYQYNDDDVWTECNVTEVREDHVVVDVTSAGIIAFIEVPAEEVVEEAAVVVPAAVVTTVEEADNVAAVAETADEEEADDVTAVAETADEEADDTEASDSEVADDETAVDDETTVDDEDATETPAE